MSLAKKLRLAAAGLTDVGRRREHNQDNLTHFVPPDENDLATKGALFVVCDGMGGHAAGEVASELGANAIRDVYYASHQDDVIDNIASAIKSANEAIYQYAQEHPESKGMGTTCVAVLIHGGRAYFVNIGDSRAYLVRDGDLRQVTFDHSWVAEQVKAGLLTEEQARTHAHRNVITRSLGTGPSVTADLFVETLKQGDRILLCSDGLHGYVDDHDIKREMITHPDPEDGVKALVDIANSNGGPDNITALLIHLLEVPPATGELRLPVPGDEEEPTITQPVPAIPAPAAKPATAASAHKTYSAKLPVAETFQGSIWKSECCGSSRCPSAGSGCRVSNSGRRLGHYARSLRRNARCYTAASNYHFTRESGRLSVDPARPGIGTCQPIASTCRADQQFAKHSG